MARGPTEGGTAEEGQAHAPVGRANEIAAGEAKIPPAKARAQARVELFEIGDRRGGGDAEGEKRGEGAGGHGGEVAEVDGEAFLAERAWVDPTASEVNAFDERVGGDEKVRSRRETQMGSVVADRDGQAGAARGPGIAEGTADPSEKPSLAPIGERGT